MTDVQHERFCKIIAYLKTQYHTKPELKAGAQNRIYKIVDDKNVFITIRLNKLKNRRQIKHAVMKGLWGLENKNKKLNFDGKINIVLVTNEASVNRKSPKKAGKKFVPKGNNGKRPFKPNGNGKKVIIKKKGAGNV